jgi:multidrug efflux pump subunit AcrB
MAEPRALDGMQPDERQELKEAVCDAILERTRRIAISALACCVGARPR